ncbi:hypothetical protein DRQ36_09770 [bacterium]|nr:MAG: hypothetical protein DRQ36_09770 [bacterium]
MANIIINEQDKQRFEIILSDFLKDSGARTVILVDKSGFVLSKAGDFAGIDAQSLAVLASGSYASTQALAKLIGELEFSAAFHQGKRSNVHISLIANYAILVAIFDASITVGVIRLYARETSKKLEPLIFDLTTRSKKIYPAPGRPPGSQGIARNE